MTNYRFLEKDRGGNSVGKEGGEGAADGNFWMVEESDDRKTHDLPFMILTISIADLIVDRMASFSDGKSSLDSVVGAQANTLATLRAVLIVLLTDYFLLPMYVQVPFRWDFLTMHTPEGMKEAKMMINNCGIWRESLVDKHGAYKSLLLKPTFDRKIALKKVQPAVKARFEEFGPTIDQDRTVQKLVEADEKASITAATKGKKKK